MQKWRNWQTRRLQVPVAAMSCGFKSHLLHHRRAARAVVPELRLAFFTFVFGTSLKAKKYLSISGEAAEDDCACVKSRFLVAFMCFITKFEFVNEILFFLYLQAICGILYLITRNSLKGDIYERRLFKSCGRYP